MAHFAEIKNGKVVQVLVVPNEEESRGQEFLSEDLGLGGTWIQTSYNSNIRGKFAAIGDKYDSKNDVFVTAIDEAAVKEAAKRAEAKAAVLAKLGLTADEVAALLG
jgi:hypothetical protein